MAKSTVDLPLSFYRISPHLEVNNVSEFTTELKVNVKHNNICLLINKFEVVKCDGKLMCLTFT